jgi:D-3-phosphoglycerate dehydrogenase
MIKVVFPDQALFDDYAPYLDALKPLEGRAEIVTYDEVAVNDDTRYERMKDADAVIFSIYKFERNLLSRLRKLRVLQFMGMNYANFVDIDYCVQNGIVVSGTGDYGINIVAEYAMAQAFALARNIVKADRLMRDGKWINAGLEGVEIADSVFGVLGTGRIGTLVAKKAALLGASVLACDILQSESLKNDYNVTYVEMDDLFACSDIVSVHLKHTPETSGLVSKKRINMMKPGALFINCARAEVVDYDALKEALVGNVIGGAALDVFCEEPLSDYSICKLPNVITSPHIGFLTEKAKGNLLRMCVDSVIKGLSFDESVHP